MAFELLKDRQSQVVRTQHREVAPLSCNKQASRAQSAKGRAPFAVLASFYTQLRMLFI